MAKTYKECGIFDTTKASSSFYPSDFAAEGKVQLSGGARFGEEMVITFNEERLQVEYEEAMREIKEGKKLGDKVK